MLDKNYNCVRPECQFDVVSQPFFNPEGLKSPEHLFERVGVTYDYIQDFDKWSHIESTPIVSPEDAGFVISEDGATKLHTQHKTYGFDQASRYGVGNPLFVWYTNTDLDITRMKEIRDVRWPIVKKILEAKEKEDLFKRWQTYKFIKKEFPENTVSPPEGEEITCEQITDLINELPLECERVKETLGEQFSGTDMSNYWWYGWLPQNYFDEQTQEPIIDLPYSGSTFSAAGENISISSKKQGVPYQTDIGVYKCSNIELDDEGNGVETGTNRPPYYGVYGGFTADPCGCVQIDDSAYPSYIKKCNYPTTGEKYNEYLEYVRSVDARFWNTPKETPLYRKAQLVTLMMQKIIISVPGDLKIKTGTIVNLKVPKSHRGGTNEIDGSLDSGISGRYLVLAVKHNMDSRNLFTSKLTLVRDTKPE